MPRECQVMKHEVRNTRDPIDAVVAVALRFVARVAISWPPPARHPELPLYYHDYFEPTPTTISLSSRSTALYMAVAAGIYAENRIVGSIRRLMVHLSIALPLISVGGHYPSDILAGFILGLAGTLSALHFFEPRLLPLVQKAIDSRWRRTLLEIVVFVWILEVMVEFEDAVWLTVALPKWLLH